MYASLSSHALRHHVEVYLGRPFPLKEAEAILKSFQDGSGHKTSTIYNKKTSQPILRIQWVGGERCGYAVRVYPALYEIVKPVSKKAQVSNRKSKSKKAKAA